MNTLVYLELEPAQIVAQSLDGKNRRVVFKMPGQFPDGLWVDQETQTIYWSLMGKIKNKSDFFEQDGSIESCDFYGHKHDILVAPGAITTPKQITVDSATEVLFFSDREGEALRAVHRKERKVKTLWSNKGSEDETFERQCVGVALSPAKDMIYWTQKGRPDGGKGRIFKSDLTYREGMPSLVGTPTLLLDHLPEPIDLDFGKISGRLYWTDRGAAPDGNSLNVATVNPEGQLVDHEIIFRGLQEGIGLALDEANHTAYVSDLGGNIRKINLQSGEANLFARQGPTTGIYLCEMEW